jgi:hypothetical protein
MNDMCNWNVCRVALLAILILVSSSTGCRRANPDKMFQQAADSNLKRLGTLYIQFQTTNTTNRLLGPKDLEEFKDFILQQNERGLKLIGVDKNRLDELFVSPRDKQPYKIRWAVQGVSRGPAQPVIFEAEGVEGTYMVGFTGFIEMSVDKPEYDRLWSGAADKG